MISKVIPLLMIFLSLPTMAQIGINTTAPEAQLDIRSSNPVTPNNTDGLLIPRVANFSATNPTATQQGMLVYLTTTSGTNEPGFYYWEDTTTSWIPIAKDANAWSIQGNSGTNPASHFFGTTDNKDVAFKRNNSNAGFLSIFRTAFGVESMDRTTNTGSFNSAFGGWALKNNTSGFYNTAVGEACLSSNTTGNSNIGVGSGTMISNTTGSNNTAIGINALSANISGDANVSIGSVALATNVNGQENVAIGSWSMYNSSNSSFQTALGTRTLYSNNSGIENTALGYESMLSNISGNYNTASGHHSLRLNTIGLENTSMGAYALASNTSGSNNTAVGTSALRNNSTSNNNTAIGWQSMWVNTSGSNNTAIGSGSLNSNTTGNANVCIGLDTLRNSNTGANNSAVGTYSLNTSNGDFNTALGYASLYSSTVGNGNTALGVFSLQNNVLGNNNTAVGRQSGGSAGFNPTNFGAFGYASGYVGTNSNTIEIGNTSISWIGGQVGFFNYSDGRIKKNVQNNVPGLAFITKLRPVTYNLDIHQQNAIVYQGMKLDEWEGKYDLENELQSGFIAQEVEATAKTIGYTFNGVKAPKHDKDLYSIQYAAFVVPLVKSIQEQQKMIEEQQNTITKLLDRIQKLEEKISK